MRKINYENELKELEKIKLKEYIKKGKDVPIEITIKEIRIKSKMSQEQFAEKLGISVQTVKKYETVKNYNKNTEDEKQTRTSPLSIIKKLAENSPYSADYILGVEKDIKDIKDISKNLGLIENYTGLNTTILKLLNQHLLQYSKSTTNSKKIDIEIYKIILNSLFLVLFPDIIILIKKYLSLTTIHKIINKKENDIYRESLSESILGISEFFKWKTIEELNKSFTKTIESIMNIIPNDFKNIDEKKLKSNDKYILGKSLIEQVMNKSELFDTNNDEKAKEIEKELLIKELIKKEKIIQNHDSEVNEIIRDLQLVFDIYRKEKNKKEDDNNKEEIDIYKIVQLLSENKQKEKKEKNNEKEINNNN